jgi:hypothetical protein
MEWHCVHIEHMRLLYTVDVTFRNMLRREYLVLGESTNCRVYRQVHPDQAYSYFFSPGASESLEVFVRFWEGFACPEPANLADWKS